MQPQFTRDIHLLHAERRRRPAVGERPAGREQLDRPRRDGELRDDQRSRPASATTSGWSSTRTAATRSRGCSGAARRRRRPSSRSEPPPPLRRRSRSISSPRARRCPPATWRTPACVFALAATARRYGWNADNTAQTRDRNATNSPDQRYDTLTHLQKPANPNAVWEIAVPNGTYTVRIVAGTPSNIDSVFGQRRGCADPQRHADVPTRWIEGTATVTVTDGRLTISNGVGSLEQQDLLRRDQLTSVSSAPSSTG